MANMYALVFLTGHVVAGAMQTYGTGEPSKWRMQKLQDLLTESQQSTQTAFSEEIRECKREFVRKYHEKYYKQQAILADLSCQTNGQYGATTDQTLAQANEHKFLDWDPLEHTANEIDERGKRIQDVYDKNRRVMRVNPMGLVFTPLCELKVGHEDVRVTNALREYEWCKMRLEELSTLTKGAIAATTDGQKAEADRYKILITDEVMNLSPYDIQITANHIRVMYQDYLARMKTRA